MFCKLVIYFLTILTFISSISFSQNKSLSWEDKHSDEPFIYLLVSRTIELKEDYSTKEIVHMAAKIQKEEAKSLGEIPISYDKSFQEVKNIRAFIITPEGKRLKYKLIQDLTSYSGTPLYSNSRTKVITMPGVVPGSIIDWQATIITKKPIMKDAFWNLFSFLFEAPVKSFQYKLIVPKNIKVWIKNHNIAIKPKVKEEDSKIIYYWRKDFVDKFDPEEYMPPADEFVKYVEISTLKNWQEIACWYWNLVKKNLKISPAMKKKVKEIVKNKSKAKDKIQAIIKYVQDNFRYVSMSFNYHCYEPHPSDEIFDNKYGDCKDQVLVCMAMLKEAGITSYPALFCDENSGDPQRKLPMLSLFDHMILTIQLDGKLYYTDVLEKGYRFDEVSPSIEGGFVFVINDKGGFFQRIPVLDESEHTTYKNVTVNIKEDGSALIEVTSLWPKELSILLREVWKNSTDKEKKEFLETLNEVYTTGGKVFERKWENMDDEYKRIKSFVKYERSHWAKVSGDLMIIDVPAYERSEDFTEKERKYPIMFWFNSLNKEIRTYIIPKNFEIVHCPEDIVIKDKFTEFSRTYKIKGRKIIQTEIARFKRVRLPASYY
ncbi:MAG: hypothetical protein DRO93_13640, partial [Candidatus Thorarchaeota archaeon]